MIPMRALRISVAALAGVLFAAFAAAQQSQQVASENATIDNGQSFTPGIWNVGSGSGQFQWCVAGYTNFDGGASSYTGTNLGPSPGNSPDADWVTSWTPPGPGNYSFYVAADENADYQAANPGIPYTLTVSGPVDGVTWNSISMPSYGLAGQQISFPATVTNSGTSTWNDNYYLQVADQDGNHLDFPSIAGVSPNGSITVTFYVDLPSTPGTYTYYFTALQNGVDYFGPTESESITVDVLPTTTLTASSTSVSVGQNVTLTSTTSSGSNSLVNQAVDISTDDQNWTSGWSNWSGATSWSGGPTGSDTLTTQWTPSTAGTYYFRARGQDSYGYLSSFSYVTVNVTADQTQTVTISPSNVTLTVGQSQTFTASGGQNGYVWGGSASGSGASQTVTFNTTGSATVTVYSPAGNGYSASPVATANVTVNSLGTQAPVSISPSGPLTCSTGEQVTFSASGGSGTGAYIWGGAASGTGSMVTVTFSGTGTTDVTVYRAGDSNYQASNTASVSVTVDSTRPDSNDETQLKLLVPTP